MIYQSQTIEDNVIDDAPAFYKNISGGTPYINRADGGIDVAKNMFKVIETVDIDATISSGTAGATFSHSLGYKPIVIGSYVMTGTSVLIGTDYPDTYRGMIPENKNPEYGSASVHAAYISAVDNNTLSIILNTSADTGSVTFRIHILREPTSG